MTPYKSIVIAKVELNSLSKDL